MNTSNGQTSMDISKEKKCKVTVVLPAYNAEGTLKKTFDDIPKDIVDDIILVDDCSNDNTVKLAKELGIFVYEHKFNLGYGGNQKTCYSIALERGADIVIMLHPDYQYDARLISYFVGLIGDKYFDVVLGSRIRSRKETLKGGMPVYKYLANRALSIFENIVTGQNLSEWHTGMRAYRREVLESINYNQFSNDFVFDSQALFKIIEKGFVIGEIPVPVRYFQEASSINFKRSMEYGIGTVFTAFSFLFRKLIRSDE